MQSGKERRRFTRYQKSALPISIGGSSFKAYISDFSLGGLSFYIETPPVTLGSIIDLKVEDLNLDIKGKVVWTRQTDSTLKVGIERLSIYGNLKHFPLSDVLLSLQRSEKTGVLEIKNGHICKKIYIRNGDIIFTASNFEEERLGEVLLKAGRITLEQYYHSVDAMNKTGKRQGTVFVELGYLTPKELVWAIMYQVEEIILSLFQWEDGEFEFIEGPLPSEEVITLKLSVANLVYRGIKRINNLTYIRNGCLHMDAIPDYSADPLNLFQDIKMEEKDKEILFLIDGKRTIEEILSLSPLDNFKTLKILYALISARIIEIEERDQTEDKTCEEGEIYKETLRGPEVELDSGFEEKVEDLYNRLSSTNYYEILGVTELATPEEIKEAYYKKTKEFHPDKHFYLSSETLKNKLNALFFYLNEAYEILSDPKNKTEYDQGLSPEALPVKGFDPETARDRFIEGKEALRKRSYTEAAELFREAVHLDSSVAVYHFCLGLALEKEKKLEDAEASLTTALKLDPLNADYIAELGYIYLDLGFNSRAKDAFEKVIELDPYNVRATEGLQKIVDPS